MSSQDPRELELKLEFDSADAVALKSLLTSRFGPPAKTEHLVSVYYDTEKQDLRKHGLSVRVRSGAGRAIQTVKATTNGGAGLFDRSEWETEIDGTEPDRNILAETPVGSFLAKGKPPLKPAFETVIDRTLWQIGAKRSTVELALDEGAVVSGQKSAPVSEIELELKQGRAADLFQLVRELDEVPSLRPGVVAKAERGFALIAKAPKPFKAEPVALTADMTAGKAFQAVLHSCLRQFRRNEPLVIATRDAEALHQARVGMRRLRSALSLFKSIASDDDGERLKTKLQALSRELGEARNLDVYLSHSARPKAERDGGEAGAAAYLAAMEQRRTAAYDKVVGTLTGAPFRRLMLDLLLWIEAGPWVTNDDPLRKTLREQPVRRVAADILRTWRRRVKKKGRHLDKIDPHRRHRVRIAAKKLRYASEFFAALTATEKERERHAAFVEALEALQQHLGDLNDIQTGHDIALSFEGGAEASAREAAPALFVAAHVSGEQDARVGELIRSASDAHLALTQVKRFWSQWS